MAVKLASGPSQPPQRPEHDLEEQSLCIVPALGQRQLKLRDSPRPQPGPGATNGHQPRIGQENARALVTERKRNPTPAGALEGLGLASWTRGRFCRRRCRSSSSRTGGDLLEQRQELLQLMRIEPENPAVGTPVQFESAHLKPFHRITTCWAVHECSPIDAKRGRCPTDSRISCSAQTGSCQPRSLGSARPGTPQAHARWQLHALVRRRGFI